MAGNCRYGRTTGHTRRESHDRVRCSACVLGLMALMLIPVSGCRAAGPDTRFVGWVQLTESTADRIVVDGSGQWVAIHQGYPGRLRVWELQPDATLGELRFDSIPAQCLVRTVVWSEERLVMGRVDGVQDEDELDAMPHDRKLAFLQEQSWLVAWDPRTGLETARERGGPSALLANPVDGHVLAFDGTGERLSVNVTTYSVPDLTTQSKARWELGEQFAGDLELALWPLTFDVTGQTLYALTRVPPEITERRPRDRGTRVAIVVVDASGTVTWLNVEPALQLWPRGDWALSHPPALQVCGLAPTPVRDGAALGCIVRGPTPARHRLVLFSPEGVVYEHEFPANWRGAPRTIAPREEATEIISITPDGSHLILQERVATYDRARALWLWDYADNTLQDLPPMPPITAVFGWWGDRLLVETTLESVGADGQPTITYEYGALILEGPVAE